MHFNFYKAISRFEAKMCTKIIFFIATLYVVNASVISLDAYDGDESFADGIVDNDIEEFDLSLSKALIEDSEAEIAEVSSDPKDLSEKRRCFPRLCNRVCRLKRLGNGTCIDGRCKCSNKVNELSAADVSSNNDPEESELKLDEEVEDTEAGIAELFLEPTDLSGKRRCSPRRCNRVCRFRRFDNGTCVDGRCRCSNKSESVDRLFADDILDNLIEDSKLNVNEVEGLAFEYEQSKLNLDEKFEGETEAKFAQLSSDPTYVSEKIRCLPRICNIVCRLKRLGNGTCVDGQCKCSGRGEKSSSILSDNLVEESDVNMDKVEDVAFNNKAEESELNYDGEVEDTEADIAAFFSDPFGDLSEKRLCFPRLCNRLCRLKRFANGTCVQGRCKCKKIESSTPDTTIATTTDYY